MCMNHPTPACEQGKSARDLQPDVKTAFRGGRGGGSNPSAAKGKQGSKTQLLSISTKISARETPDHSWKKSENGHEESFKGFSKSHTSLYYSELG